MQEQKRIATASREPLHLPEHTLDSSPRCWGSHPTPTIAQWPLNPVPVPCVHVHVSHRFEGMNNRKYPRQKTSRPAKILAGGKHGLPCRISNLCQGGAMLRTDMVRWLPTSFQLQDGFTGIVRDVVIVWRGADCVGIRFLDAASHARSSHRLAFGRRGNT